MRLPRIVLSALTATRETLTRIRMTHHVMLDARVDRDVAGTFYHTQAAWALAM
jgi:hypothetical protein